MACGENARGEGSIVDEEKLGLVTIRWIGWSGPLSEVLFEYAEWKIDYKYFMTYFLNLLNETLHTF